MLNGIESAKSVSNAEWEKPVTTVTRDVRPTETTELVLMSNTEMNVALLEANKC